jgi:hypothetical protein
LFAVVLISVVRFVRLARRLSRYSGERILAENIVKGEADPDLLAASALASRVPSKTIPEKRANSESSTERASVEKALYILRVAESRFLYLWERCYADMESTKRASLLTLLLSFAMVTHGAYPIFYYGCYNDGKVTGYDCLFRTAEQLIVTLGFGLSLGAMLYLGSSFIERKLADRKTCWKYFCSRLKTELSRA